jgi:hypothetical protein
MKTFVKMCVVWTVSFGMLACVPTNKDGEVVLEVKVKEELVAEICDDPGNQEAAAAVICDAVGKIIEEHGGIREITHQATLGICDAIRDTGTVVVVTGACEIAYTINEAKCGMQTACSSTWAWVKNQCGFGPEVGPGCGSDSEGGNDNGDFEDGKDDPQGSDQMGK